MRYAVIMAGGSGKRLWPASRRKKPKQLIRLIDGKCLLELAMARLAGMFPPERTLVVTSAAYVDEVCDCFGSVPRENVIGEPEGRDTANAIALAAELIAARDDDATMAVFTADHVIRPVDEFARCVGLACDTAEKHPEALVTFGIPPTWPHPGLGYIQCGEEIEPSVRLVTGFKEKPGHHDARIYVESDQYVWNSGMFFWRVDTIRQTLKRLLPESTDRLVPVGAAARDGKDITDLLQRIYPQLPRISIDFAVMEKAPHVLMVELTCEWLDVGAWPSLSNVVTVDGADNAIIASRVTVLDGSRNVIFSDDEHLVAVVGMDDCIIVHTPDATLVCNKSDSQRLRDLVDMIGERFGSEYL